MRTGWGVAIGVVLVLAGGLIGSLIAATQNGAPDLAPPAGELDRSSPLVVALDSTGHESLALTARKCRFGAEAYTLGNVALLTQGQPLDKSAVLSVGRRFARTFEEMGLREEVAFVEVCFYAHEPERGAVRTNLSHGFAGGWGNSGYGPGRSDEDVQQWRAAAQSTVSTKHAVHWYGCVTLVRVVEWSAPGGREHAEPRQGQGKLSDWHHKVHWCEANRSTVRPEGKQYPELVMSSFEANPRGTR